MCIGRLSFEEQHSYSINSTSNFIKVINPNNRIACRNSVIIVVIDLISSIVINLIIIEIIVIKSFI